MPLAPPSPAALPAEARAAVLAWYDARGRALAFRGTRDPYAILVSEVMAQQTQISRVVEAWSRFLERFPTVAALAAATPADVLRAWRGMGYDRRALNLHRAAQVIVAEHGGQVPRTREALEALPGVGRKTANVVLNVAFGESTIAVDTHIFRVGNRTGLATGKNPFEVEQKLEAVVPGEYKRHAHHWLILHGRYTCLARKPLCERCVIADLCKWPGKTAL